MNFEVVIGIEIHCELKTKSKMFSGAPVGFAHAPNSCTNEIDLGHPGTLPCLNKEAVRLSLIACELLHCQVDRLIRFDRKNYYYSDLPKGYQITQQFHPIGRNGYVDLELDGNRKRIHINRLHMEEDTAKQFHYDDGTYIDFNRAGTPLVEIVSEADIRSGIEAAAFVEKLRLMLEYSGVSDVKMEEGSMRCDVNISLRPFEQKEYGVKVEIKNLNSVTNVQRAIEAEIRRQSQLLTNQEVIHQETRRYDENSRTTILMRKKEGTVDYKYFPEPNIPPILISDEFYDEVVATMPETPEQRLNRYTSSLNLSDYDAQVLMANKELSDYFDQICSLGSPAKLVANWLISEVLAVLNQKGPQSFKEWIKPAYFAEFIGLIQDATISSKQAKEVFEYLLKNEKPQEVVQRLEMTQVLDESLLLQWIDQVLQNNPQSIEDYKNGKDRAQGFLMGQIMKLSKGKANPALTSALLIEELKKR